MEITHKGNSVTVKGYPLGVGAQLVQKDCRKAGIEKPMSPHRIRHSHITTALNVTDGNVRKVQKLSRHSNLDTLMIYDDHRSQDQLEISD